VTGPRDTLRAMPLRIMVSRHSIFYSPLIATIAAGFLERHGMSAEYSILAAGHRSSTLIRDGSVDIMQSAVSSN
jgi:NitT/TauT family transport system substrate-binding protein